MSTHGYRFSLFTLSFHFEDFRFMETQNIYFYNKALDFLATQNTAMTYFYIGLKVLL